MALMEVSISAIVCPFTYADKWDWHLISVPSGGARRSRYRWRLLERCWCIP